MKKFIAIITSISMVFTLTACGNSNTTVAEVAETEEVDKYSNVVSDKEYIETTLNLANNEEKEWTYSQEDDAWVLSIVSAVAYPEIEDQQGVSVCVPAAYVVGIDTDKDGIADVTANDYTDAVKGDLVIDYDAEIISTNGQTYTAGTAPVILNTGAAGYGSSTNTLAATTYAKEGYINVSCGNRGKQDTATDENGNTYYTGDAPSCLVDQKNAARFVKYNILLGNLPGNVDYFVSTGGSGGGAHATMFALTSNNPDFYDYEIEAGAVGVYLLDDGSYTTTVTIDNIDYEISDGAWGCMAYSAITPLADADMALAFEYYMNTEYDFGTPFKNQLAEYLSTAYMEYINNLNLTVSESSVDVDLNNDGDKDDIVSLTIEYDPENYPETNGYYGTYLDLYLAKFQENLQWYLDNLDYADDFTWFDDNGNALTDEEVANMSASDKAVAFIEGRYAKSSSGKGNMGAPGDIGNDGDLPDGDLPDDIDIEEDNERSFANDDVAANSAGDTMDVGTPDAGTTQAAGSTIDSANYATYEEMVQAYREDIAEIEDLDEYGNNIVDLYNPLNYIDAYGTENPTWVRILMGASEGDMSMFSSLNLWIYMLNANIDANIEWQWDGGHVPSEILSSSFSLYIDQMYGKYVNGNTIEAKEATKQTENGTETSPNGTDLSSWVDYSDITNVSFSLEDIIAYRTNGASKTVPSFDVIDYGQEDYVFGSKTKDARHWNKYLLEIYENYAAVLEPLFNNA